VAAYADPLTNDDPNNTTAPNNEHTVVKRASVTRLPQPLIFSYPFVA
jgi:hypothetical protein